TRLRSCDGEPRLAVRVCCWRKPDAAGACRRVGSSKTASSRRTPKKRQSRRHPLVAPRHCCRKRCGCNGFTEYNVSKKCGRLTLTPRPAHDLTLAMFYPGPDFVVRVPRPTPSTSAHLKVPAPVRRCATLPGTRFKIFPLVVFGAL